MSARKETYFVFPLDEMWMVSAEGEFEAWGPYNTSAEAVRVAKNVAKANLPSEVLLRGANGRWQVKYSGLDS
jgi:hypothetical protein